ncbi:MAG: hypothetical protein Q7S88_02050 [Candidatus Daviesbacteria bacterium]|nr:hypothetical protein [Candidatus Daviesbacteria bacterium]
MVDIPKGLRIGETSISYSKSPISRRRLGGLLALPPILALASGCRVVTPTEAPPTPQASIRTPVPAPRLSAAPPPQIEYPLEMEGEYLVDKKLGNHPYLTSLKYSFDPRYAGGSLKMDLETSKASEMRLATFEVTPNQRWIYCKPHRQPGDERLWPVIRFIQGDSEVIHLGFKAPGAPCIDEYTGMRAYLLTRKPDGALSGGFVGLRNLDPNNPTFIPQDSEAATYWQKGCLI